MKFFLPLLSLLIVPAVNASIYSSDVLPEKAYTFEFNVRTINFELENDQKIFEAVNLLSQVFVDPEFRERILNYRYDGRRAFAQNKGFSNKRIYEQILNGMEKLQPEENNAMDVEIALYSDYDSKVLGFTRPNTQRIWMNTKYFKKNSLAELAGNLTHEWLHKLGFGHEEEWTKDREHSVPYAVGYIVRDIAERIHEETCYQERSEERPWRFCGGEDQTRGVDRNL